ncbi:MAG: MscL family protein [Candidatus Nanohaloarchaea archaeon]|nr:MscL family protein [Candidatus Nanohaloarchaea archaeon]
MQVLPDDFLRFLKEYGVIGLALAVVIGTAVKDLVNAVVDGAVMPVIGVVLPGEEWRAAAYTVAGVEFQVGLIIGATLDFAIIAVLVYLFVRHALKQETVEKV